MVVSGCLVAFMPDSFPPFSAWVKWEFSLEHAVAFETDPMGVVDDSVEDFICDCRFTDMSCHCATGSCAVMSVDFAPVAFLEEALLIVEAVGTPIVEDQQLDAGDLVDERGKRPSRRAMARFSNRRRTRR